MLPDRGPGYVLYDCEASISAAVGFGELIYLESDLLVHKAPGIFICLSSVGFTLTATA
jgi:hypothetical protein